MHLGNGIICPVTGMPMIAAAGVAAFYAFRAAKKDFTKDKILPTITLTSLVFALQMINFAIPETGSSGHIVGGVLLAALLGAPAGFLAMCSILVVQSVFFADGGLLALGCNIFNMGFLACFAAYPIFYKPLADKNKPALGAILACIAALQLGSISVVLEGVLSGSIPLENSLNFTGLMQTIHLPIGIFEGVVSAVIILLARFINIKNLSCIWGGTALILAGIISQYTSQKPDGLEWSLMNISDSVIIQSQGILYNIFETIQAKTAIFSHIPSASSNILGLLIATFIMYIICKILAYKTSNA